MGTHHKLIAFDRPLANATVLGRPGKLYSEKEVAAIRAQAYQEGGDAARAFADQQLVEFRADVQALQDGLFQKLAAFDQETAANLRGSLPHLVMDLAERLLAGYKPDAEHVVRLCVEALEELYPEKENLELTISPADAELLDTVSEEWRARFPGLKTHVDKALRTGDCHVRSRFGLTDARLACKLQALRRELISA